ncbi:unnamed protein product, partial [marine sediment metagenome]
MLKPSVVKSAERHGTSRSDAVEKILEHHISNEARPNAPTDTLATNKFFLRLSERITENKNTIDFLARKAEYL